MTHHRILVIEDARDLPQLMRLELITRRLWEVPDGKERDNQRGQGPRPEPVATRVLGVSLTT